MLKNAEKPKHVKFNVRVNLAAIYLGKSKSPDFRRLFTPRFITMPLKDSFDVTYFPHITQTKKEINLIAAEEVP